MTDRSHSDITSKSDETLGSLLSLYVSGTLPRPVSALVAAHMELRPSSLMMVCGLEAAAGSEIEALEAERFSSMDRMFDEIVGSKPPARAHERPGAASGPCGTFPRSMVDFVGHVADDVPWRTKLPGFREYDMGEADGCHASLLWIRPGRAMPTHTHEGSELTLVLQGGFTDVDGHYVRGDIAAADETIEHRPVADDDEPCICFAVTTAPLKLTGSYAQLFSDIFGR